MKLKWPFTYLALCLTLHIHAQQAETYFLAEIESDVFDVSGIVHIEGRIFIIGDSGNDPAIYEIDTSGQILHKTHLANAENIDWEELHFDEAGNLYAAETGNNLGYFEHLAIYKIPWFIDQAAQDTIFNAQKIEFTFSDQEPNPQPNGQTHFDCEAFLVYDGTIELYSKNRALTGYAKRYHLPTLPGQYEAQLIDSFPTPHWVNGATRTPSGEIILLSDDSYFTLDTMEKTTSSPIPLVGSQLEGIVSLSENEFLIVEDVEDYLNSRLYGVIIEAQGQMDVSIFPNPTQNRITIASQNQVLEITVRDTQGKLQQVNTWEWHLGSLSLDLSNLAAGIYLVNVRDNGGFSTHKVRVR